MEPHAFLIDDKAVRVGLASAAAGSALLLVADKLTSKATPEPQPTTIVELAATGLTAHLAKVKALASREPATAATVVKNIAEMYKAGALSEGDKKIFADWLKENASKLATTETER
jgi:hypothetical protein